jgi:hypothetical protein
LPLIDAFEARLRADTRYAPERTTRALFRPSLVALAVAAVAASGTRSREREEADEHRRRAVQSARLPPR